MLARCTGERNIGWLFCSDVRYCLHCSNTNLTSTVWQQEILTAWQAKGWMISSPENQIQRFSWLIEIILKSFDKDGNEKAWAESGLSFVVLCWGGTDRPIECGISSESRNRRTGPAGADRNTLHSMLSSQISSEQKFMISGTVKLNCPIHEGELGRMCVCCKAQSCYIDETTFYQNTYGGNNRACCTRLRGIGVGAQSPARLQQEAAPTDFNKNLSLMSNYQVGTSRRAWLAYKTAQQRWRKFSKPKLTVFMNQIFVIG